MFRTADFRSWLAHVRTSGIGRSWAVACAAAALYMLAGLVPDGLTGLVRTVVANTPNRESLDVRRVTTIDLAGIDAVSGGPEGVIVRWQGVWEVPAGLRDLRLESDGRSTWTIDGILAIETASATADAVWRTVWLTGGFHSIEISCEVVSATQRLVAMASKTGEPLESLAPAVLKPRLPRNPRLRAIAHTARTVFGWLALVAAVWAVRRTISAVSERLRRRTADPAGTYAGVSKTSRSRAWAVRALAWTALACIVVHGALLRIDAITGRYGTVTSPSWLAAVQARSIALPQAIGPAAIVWEPEPLYPHRDGPPTHYRSDPYTYLDAARNMTSFYAAQFREPVFPFATKLVLGLLGGPDVAVSFASAFFSVLAIWLTYLLGAVVWSRPIGLLAALGLSLDYDVISLASLGWRDDAYMAAVTLCAYLMLRCWKTESASERVRRLGRLRMDTVYLSAAAVGVAGGLAILTRIMAVSFLASGVVWFVLAHPSAWRQRLAAAGLAVATAVLVAAPYFVNCWRVYGDPFYTFNVHGAIYSAAEGQAGWTGSTASYVRQKIASRPMEALDTVTRGLSTYPFTNKWHGLDRWVAGLGGWALVAGLAGLAVLAATARGRLLLIVMVSSLAPFSLTWTVDPDFRFTEHVYPILLTAAAVAVGAGVRAAFLERYRGTDAIWRRIAWRPWVGMMGTAAVVLWFVGRLSASLVFAETLQSGDDATVTAGTRDEAVFCRGWSDVVTNGNVSVRVTTTEGALSIRLPDQADYPATLRMDPFPRPLGEVAAELPVVEVELNGTAVASIPLRWTPGRVGSYDVVFPGAAVRRGTNRLVLRVTRRSRAIQPGLTDGDAVALWYVRVHPSASRPAR